MLHIEIEFAAGLEDFTHDEILTTLSAQDVRNLQITNGEAHFLFGGKTAELHRLRTVNAVYIRCEFPVPRPKALLGHQNFHRIVDAIKLVLKDHPDQSFQTLGISAAGSQSSVMTRIKHELAAATNLEPVDEVGDLFLRIKREPDLWVVLIRLSPRPAATRSWRVCDMEGALNGPVAAAIIQMAGAKVNDRVINLMSGSGTLLIENALVAHNELIMGVELDADSMQCAQRNIDAAGLTSRVLQIRGDATNMPFPDNFADVIMADLPFGQLVGSHDQNIELYPAVLRETARIAAPQARFVLITHEVRLMERLLRSDSDWRVNSIYPIELRGLHPRIFVLQKSLASV